METALHEKLDVSSVISEREKPPAEFPEESYLETFTLLRIEFMSKSFLLSSAISYPDHECTSH